MVGGRNYDESPFNLATEGERQPGSSFKAFDLAAALEQGISPDSEWPSKEKTFFVHGPNGTEKFVVHNDEGAYTGENTLTGATAYSDNSIFAEVGLKVGTHHIADLAHRMGITTPLSTNPAMTIGGLTHRRHAAGHGARLRDDRPRRPARQRHAGRRRRPRGHPGSRLAAPARSPTAPTATSTGADQTACCPPASPRPRPRCSRPCSSTAPPKPPRSANSPPARPARPPTTATPGSSAGTTSTRSPCGSATPTGAMPMTTDYDGGPVLGGTFPALIWHDFMISALRDRKGTGRTRRRLQARRRRRQRQPVEHEHPRSGYAVEHGGGAEPDHGADDGRGRGQGRRRQVRHARWGRRRSRNRCGRRRWRRTRTRRLAGAGDTYARSPERTFLPLLTRAVHAGGGR